METNISNMIKENDGTVNIVCALQSKWFGTQWKQSGDTYDGLEWFDVNSDPIPSEDEINTEIIRLQAEYDAQEYARNRAAAYPSTGDQLDMMYKDTKNSTTTHAAAVEAVKTKWPKDNSGPV